MGREPGCEREAGRVMVSSVRQDRERNRLKKNPKHLLLLEILGFRAEGRQLSVQAQSERTGARWFGGFVQSLLQKHRMSHLVPERISRSLRHFQVLEGDTAQLIHS